LRLEHEITGQSGIISTSLDVLALSVIWMIACSAYEGAEIFLGP